MKDIPEALENETHSQITNPQRRMMLMKKLRKIKLSQSFGNSSFKNFGDFYERKFRRLKNNNVALARALAEQRQITQSWYEEVVALKEELHETRSDLLRYQISENADDDIIQTAAERRIREVAVPLESAAKDCLDHVLGVVDSMTKVKQLVANLVKIKDKKLSSSSSSSSGSNGSRPPLTRSSKSPRKNVVHPMVEGHVLQPAAIHIPRMTLEERRRYRLQERAENREAGVNVMGMIGEHSTSVVEENTAEEDEDELPLISFQTPRTTSKQLTPTTVTPIESQEPEPDLGAVSLAEDPSSEHSECLKLEPPRITPVKMRKASVHLENKSREYKKAIELEDPLEGSSWMHLKRKRAPKKRKSGSSGTSLRRSTALVGHVDSSSDSEEEKEFQRKLKKHSKPSVVSNQKEARSSSLSPVEDCLPILCLTPMEEPDNRVCRRSTRRTRISERSKKEELENKSFGSKINESDSYQQNNFADESSLLLSPMESATVARSSVEATSSTVVVTTTPSCSPLSPSLVASSCRGDTTMSIKTSTPMKCGLMTIPPEDKDSDVIFVAELEEVKSSPKNPLKEGKKQKVCRRISKTKKDKSFPRDSIREEVSEISKSTVNMPNDRKVEKLVVFDASKKGKENVPPKVEAATENVKAAEVSMNLKNVSIVVKDIMKTPNLAANFSLFSCEINKDQRKISAKSGGGGTKIMSSSDKSTPPKNKKNKKAKKRIDESSNRKDLRTKRKVQFSLKQQNESLVPAIQINSDLPPAIETKAKRQKIPKLKITTNQLPKPALCEANSQDDSIFECSSDTFVGFEDYPDLENNNNSTNQMENLTEEPSAFLHLDLVTTEEPHPKEDEILENNNIDDPVEVIPLCANEEIETTDPIFKEILEEVTTLLKDNLDYDEFNPLDSLPLLMKEDPESESSATLKAEAEALARAEEEVIVAETETEDEPQCVAVINSIAVCSPFNSSSSGELVKARPRRAAARVTSLKEPSLNTKLRQGTTNSKC